MGDNCQTIDLVGTMALPGGTIAETWPFRLLLDKNPVEPKAINQVSVVVAKNRQPALVLQMQLVTEAALWFALGVRSFSYLPTMKRSRVERVRKVCGTSACSKLTLTGLTDCRGRARVLWKTTTILRW